jgi:uncharacterized lipoprotein YmbA
MVTINRFLGHGNDERIVPSSWRLKNPKGRGFTG